MCKTIPINYVIFFHFLIKIYIVLVKNLKADWIVLGDVTDKKVGAESIYWGGGKWSLPFPISCKTWIVNQNSYSKLVKNQDLTLCFYSVFTLLCFYVTGDENESKLYRTKCHSKKMSMISNGEVFFLLTHPLMGDPAVFRWRSLPFSYPSALRIPGVRTYTSQATCHAWHTRSA